MAKNITKDRLKTEENKLVKLYDNLGFYLLAIILFIIPLYFNIKSYDQFELPKLTLLRILTALLLGIWLLKSVELKRIEFIKTPLDFPLILLVIMNIICTFISVAPHLSFRGEYENFAGSLSNINYVILYFLAVQFIKEKKHLNILCIAFLLSGFLITLYSIAQFFGYDFIKWNEESVIKGRYFASMGNPNFLGALLIMIIPATIAYFIIAIINKNKLFAFLLFILFILLYLSLFGTQSRGPFLGFVFSILFLSIYGIYKLYKDILKNAELSHLSPGTIILTIIKKYKIWIAITIIFFTIAVILSLTLGKNATKRITESITDIKGSLQQSRLHIWIPAFKIIKDYPLLGSGVDTFKAIFPKYEGLDFAYIDGTNVSSRTAHNEILHIAATMGIFSLSVYLTLLFAYTRMFLKPFGKINDIKIKLISLALFSGFIAYFIQNLFSFGVAAINTTLYIFMACHAFIYNNFFNIKKINLIIAKNEIEYPVKFMFYIIIFIFTFFLIFKSYNMLLADYSYNKGKILGNVYGRWDLAIKEHIKSIEKEPYEVKYHVYLGLAFEQLAIRTEDVQNQKNLILNSIKEYKKGIELNPANSYYWGNLGRIYSLLAKIENNPEYYNQAIYYYIEASKRAPVTGLFYHNLMEVYLRTNMLNEALKTYEKLEYCDKRLTSNAAFLLGNLFFANKDFQRALEFYTKAVTYSPDFYQAQFNLGVTFATLNEKKTAIEIFEKLLQQKPDFEKAEEAKKILQNLKK